MAKKKENKTSEETTVVVKERSETLKVEEVNNEKVVKSPLEKLTLFDLLNYEKATTLICKKHLILTIFGFPFPIKLSICETRYNLCM